MTRAQWEARRPVLSPEDAAALDVWTFCEGWHPERVPLAAAYYGVQDLAGLIDRLMIIRDAMRARAKAGG